MQCSYSYYDLRLILLVGSPLLHLLLTGVASIFDKMLVNTSGGLFHMARNCACNVSNGIFLKTEAKDGKIKFKAIFCC